MRIFFTAKETAIINAMGAKSEMPFDEETYLAKLIAEEENELSSSVIAANETIATVIADFTKTIAMAVETAAVVLKTNMGSKTTHRAKHISVEGIKAADTMMVVLADGSVNPEFVATHSQTETVAALNAYYDKVEAEERAAAGAPVEAVTTSVDPVASFDGVLQDSVSKLATRFGNRTNKNRRNKGE